MESGQVVTKVELQFDIDNKTWSVRSWYGDDKLYTTVMSQDVEIVRDACGATLKAFYITTQDYSARVR